MFWELLRFQQMRSSTLLIGISSAFHTLICWAPTKITVKMNGRSRSFDFLFHIPYSFLLFWLACILWSWFDMVLFLPFATLAFEGPNPPGCPSFTRWFFRMSRLSMTSNSPMHRASLQSCLHHNETMQYRLWLCCFLKSACWQGFAVICS